jgi:hypothetical protein
VASVAAGAVRPMSAATAAAVKFAAAATMNVRRMPTAGISQRPAESAPKIAPAVFAA